MSENFEILTVNKSGDEVISILLDRGRGPEEVPGTDENVLLYIHGMYDFIHGQNGVTVQEDPEISIKPTSNNSVYIVTFGDRPVQTMPSDSDQILEAVKELKENGNIDLLREVYEKVIDTQVRRDVVNKLIGVLDNFPRERLRITDSGWLVDDYYLVDWTASVYTKGGTDKSYHRGGGGVVEADKSHEFVELMADSEPDRKKIKIDGEVKTLGEREMLFLSKAEWLINRTEYHKDEPFWRWNEKKRKKEISG